MAVSELPGNPNAVWTVKRNTEGELQCICKCTKSFVKISVIFYLFSLENVFAYTVVRSGPLFLTLWRSLLPYGYSYKKHPVLHRVKPSFVIFDIRALCAALWWYADGIFTCAMLCIACYKLRLSVWLPPSVIVWKQVDISWKFFLIFYKIVVDMKFWCDQPLKGP